MAIAFGPPGIVIRDSTASDLASVRDIYTPYVLGASSTFEVDPPTIEELASRRAAVLERGLPFLIAEVDGKAAGYAYAGPYRPRPAYRYTIENSLYVAKDLHRNGIGQALLTTLIDRCERGPWRQMIAVIAGEDNIASIALHSSLGFRTVGRFESVGFKLGEWIDTTLMQRSLGEGDGSLPVVS